MTNRNELKNLFKIIKRAYLRDIIKIDGKYYKYDKGFDNKKDMENYIQKYIKIRKDFIFNHDKTRKQWEVWVRT